MSHVLVSQPDWTDALCDELVRHEPGTSVDRKAAAVVAVDEAPLPSALAFARQCLPWARMEQAASINDWARCIAERLDDLLALDAPGPWRLHAFVPEGCGVSLGRVELIGEAFDAILDRKRRSWRRARRSPTASWHDDELLAQVAFLSRTHAAVSLLSSERRRSVSRLVSRLPGGVVDIERDPRPPSRAYQKLLEVELRLDRRIGEGERCVDLGAAPGGWTHVALERGARVLAIDRSPLRRDLMRHPRLDFRAGDAFEHVPERPVDWLFCDVAATPDRAIDLLETWLGRRWCRHFVVTLKLKGRERDARIDAAIAMLARLAPRSPGCRWNVRHLDHNGNEVTMYGVDWS